MLDIHLVRENPAAVKSSEKKRGRDPAVADAVLKLDQSWKKELKKVEELKHKRNVVSQEINEAKKSKKEKEAVKKIKEMRDVVDEIKKGEEKTALLLQERDEKLTLLGNILHQRPFGKR